MMMMMMMMMMRRRRRNRIGEDKKELGRIECCQQVAQYRRARK